MTRASSPAKTNQMRTNTPFISGLLLATCLIALTPAPSAQADIFTWKNEKGTTVFSDQDHPEASTLPTPQTQTFKQTTPESAKPAKPTSQKPAKPAINYTSLAITTPVNDASIWNNTGNITVNISLTPALQEDHQIQLQLDGSTTLIKSSSHTFLNIDRGTHSLKASVINQHGTILISSPLITFHIKRHSILFPR